MTERTKYRGVTGIAGYAVLPEHYSDDDIDDVIRIGGAFHNFAPSFIGKVGTRIRYKIGNDGKIIKHIIPAQE